MTCYFAKGNKINGKPYEETGIYKARTKTTFELEVVKHRGVYG